MNMTSSAQQATLPTVLLVDDDPAIRALCGSSLQNAGLTVLTAQDADQALQINKTYQGPIHLLIVDIVLSSAKLQLQTTASQRPTMHGMVLMRKILATRPQTRALLISGQPQETLQSLSVFKHPIPFLKKPFGEQTFLRTVREVLTAPAPRDLLRQPPPRA